MQELHQPQPAPAPAPHPQPAPGPAPAPAMTPCTWLCWVTNSTTASISPQEQTVCKSAECRVQRGLLVWPIQIPYMDPIGLSRLLCYRPMETLRSPVHITPVHPSAAQLPRRLTGSCHRVTTLETPEIPKGDLTEGVFSKKNFGGEQ